ncbi:ABC transporter substrate-binding protein [Mangrovibrevibacter kandeliae]|uniref:ABC transporter substrate-binding protein n=1 Tax=Mangrovibrevibacter kandeliae TaxID=2968473 RepID=UPI002117C380|nr:ABC transporter substrate-binding protein [Aurantimonas sp. CSK15Z-1]MCQ8781053.1 ABC transporter substrate-binding protein [Aurantimonas sp. CSK15Z-1]
MNNFVARAASVAVLLSMSTAMASAQSMDELVAAAKKEGQLTTIALPHDWCGYGDVIEGFKAKYGLTVNELNPNAGSGDEIEAIKANKGNTGPQAPDVIDVGLSFGPAAKKDGLLAPYKVSTWDSIPDSAKDPEGYWYGDYYGVLAMGVNKDLVQESPTSFADLKDSKYANSVAIPGDPRTGNSTMMTVYGAGVAAAGKAGADAATAGISFFKDLKDNGNFVPVNGSAQNMAQGTTPILFDWDYNILAMRDKLAGNPPMDVVVPSDAVIAGVYVQAISAFAPHPDAAKLWMEYLYSDEGQIGWLKGYCHPIRFNDLAANGKVPQELIDKMPAPEGYAKAVFPSLDEQSAAKAVVAETWGQQMGAQ